MFFKKFKKKFIILTAILLAIYFVSFGFLVGHKFQLWLLSPFVESQIAVFMSAGAIAIITGIILIFQSTIDSEQKKKQEVFKKKIYLYSKVINKMNSIRLSGKVTEEDQSKILSMCSNIALLSNPETYKEFNEFAWSLTEEDGNISDEYPKKLMKFVRAARDDLEVHATMTREEEKDFENTVAESKEVITEYSYSRKFFEDINGLIEYLSENKKLSQKTEKILKYVYTHLNNNKSDNFKFIFKFSPSYLGIRKDEKIYLRIKTYKSAVIIEHLDENKGEFKNFFKNQGIDVNPMTERRWKVKGLYTIKFEELEDFKKCEDKIVEYLNYGSVVS